MAKRRNLKKEKALRNQAYARKFRKRTSGGRTGRRSFAQSNRSSEMEDDQENRENTEGAAD